MKDGRIAILPAIVGAIIGIGMIVLGLGGFTHASVAPPVTTDLFLEVNGFLFLTLSALITSMTMFLNTRIDDHIKAGHPKSR